MLHIRLVQQYHRGSVCHVQLSASSLVRWRPRYEDEPHYVAQAIQCMMFCLVVRGVSQHSDMNASDALCGSVGTLRHMR